MTDVTTVNWKEVCKGCGKCCGPVPFEPDFLLENKHLYQEEPITLEHWPRGLIIPITDTLDCVFLDKNTKRCLIYKKRPRVCRLQGTIPELPCPQIENQND